MQGLNLSQNTLLGARLVAESGPWETVISTGSHSFNTLMGGGLKQGQIVQVYGAAGSGKSMLAHTCAVTTQLYGGKVFYIDTEGKFRPEILFPIAEKLNVKNVLDNIVYVRAHSVNHQLQILKTCDSILRSFSVPSLIIVDSVIALYRSEYDSCSMDERQAHLGAFMTTLRGIARQFSMAVLLTNQLTTVFPQYGNPTSQPTGGQVLKKASNTIIEMGTEMGTDTNQRYAKLSSIKFGFYITGLGVLDL